MLADALGIAPQTLGGWRRRDGFPAEPDEVAVRLWHERAQRERRRGPAMADLSAASDEVLDAMAARRGGQQTEMPMVARDRREAAQAELAEIRLQRERGDLISRAEAESWAIEESRALLVEITDLVESFPAQLTLPAPEREHVRQVLQERFGQMRDRLAAVDDGDSDA